MIKETAEQAEITKRVYPHLLRHSVATMLLEGGMPIKQVQKFLGHSKLETTQVYAESSTAMLRESYQKALSRCWRHGMQHIPYLRAPWGVCQTASATNGHSLQGKGEDNG